MRRRDGRHLSDLRWESKTEKALVDEDEVQAQTHQIIPRVSIIPTDVISVPRSARLLMTPPLHTPLFLYHHLRRCRRSLLHRSFNTPY